MQVLIVGGGPVGLTLALSLGQLGVSCEVVDARPAPGWQARAERCDARSMEIFRRLGLAPEIRAAGLPAYVPMDVLVCAGSLSAPPLVRHTYPAVRALFEAASLVNDGTTALEPHQVISQYTLEPLIREAAEATPGVTVRFGTELVDLSSLAGGVTAVVSSGARTRTVRTDYVVGCDGADSTVRQLLGIEMRGQTMAPLRQALFYCPDLFERITAGRGRHYYLADMYDSLLIVQDDMQHFALQAAGDAPLSEIFESLAGPGTGFKIVHEGHWAQRLMLADRYARGRVLLAGDAAHSIIAADSLGMNTGIGDAADLAWKLAATLNGWGGPDLLGSYEAERRPIAARNIAAARTAAAARRRWLAEWRPDIGSDTPAGARTRARLAQAADIEQRRSNDMPGIELGYRYAASRLVVKAAATGPDPDGFGYVPSTLPGSRIPHVWLDDGSALHDHLGPGFTLLRFPSAVAEPDPRARRGRNEPQVMNDAVDDYAQALVSAFGRLGAPLSVLPVDSAAVQAVCAGHRLILVRPDLHVAWRYGDWTPEPAELAARVTGHRVLSPGEQQPGPQGQRPEHDDGEGRDPHSRG
jgi:2-polyprenyl-6-methoxyphenol hydroxylase-like FAD-dependent oxidoreductase